MPCSLWLPNRVYSFLSLLNDPPMWLCQALRELPCCLHQYLCSSWVRAAAAASAPPYNANDANNVFFFFCFSFTLSDPADVKRKMVLFVSSFPKDLFSIDCHHRKAVLLSSFFFLRENVAYCVCPMSDWLFFTWWPISLLILNSQPAFFVVYQ